MSYIAIIDYNIGNIKSINNAFSSIGAKAVITRDKDEILAADGVVLPGVGAFSHGMDKLLQYDLIDTIKTVASKEVPLLGVCLGMQLLFDSSEEFGNTKGLGLIPGKVVKITPLDPRFPKLPHVSWNAIVERECTDWNETILHNINSGEDMYFVHSYMVVPEHDKHILSRTAYSNLEFCSTVKNGNIFGCQYHPEKSAEKGLKIIDNFVNISKGKIYV